MKYYLDPALLLITNDLPPQLLPHRSHHPNKCKTSPMPCDTGVLITQGLLYVMHPVSTYKLSPFSTACAMGAMFSIPQSSLQKSMYIERSCRMFNENFFPCDPVKYIVARKASGDGILQNRHIFARWRKVRTTVR